MEKNQTWTEMLGEDRIPSPSESDLLKKNEESHCIHCVSTKKLRPAAGYCVIPSVFYVILLNSPPEGRRKFFEVFFLRSAEK